MARLCGRKFGLSWKKKEREKRLSVFEAQRLASSAVETPKLPDNLVASQQFDAVRMLRQAPEVSHDLQRFASREKPVGRRSEVAAAGSIKGYAGGDAACWARAECACGAGKSSVITQRDCKRLSQRWCGRTCK